MKTTAVMTIDYEGSFHSGKDAVETDASQDQGAILHKFMKTDISDESPRANTLTLQPVHVVSENDTASG